MAERFELVEGLERTGAPSLASLQLRTFGAGLALQAARSQPSRRHGSCS
jgi:hypothetical protein